MDRKRRLAVTLIGSLVGLLPAACDPTRRADPIDALADRIGDALAPIDGAISDSGDAGSDADLVTGRPCASSPACGPTGWCNPATGACQLRDDPTRRQFTQDVAPVFQKEGCVSCHGPGGPGAIGGTAHVPLILAGSTYEAWAALVAGGTDCSDGLARRICVDEPRLSLLARWPLQLPGEPSRIVVAFQSWGDAELQAMLQWIAQGARYDGPPPGDGGGQDVRDAGALDVPPPPQDARDVSPPPQDAQDARDDTREDTHEDTHDDTRDPQDVPDAGVIDVPADAPRDAADGGPLDAPSPPTDTQFDINLADTTPPVLSGLVTVAAASCQSAVVSWNAATDDRSPPDRLRYDVCWSTTPTGCAGSSGTHATLVGPTTMSSIAGLTVQTTYYAAVFAIDETGNRSPAISSSSFMIPAGFNNAVVPPPSAPFSASAATATSFVVTWGAAVTGACFLPGQLSYQVCVATSPLACGGTGAAWVTAQSIPAGTTTATLSALAPATAYSAFVRTVYGTGASARLSVGQTTKVSFMTNVVPILSNSCNGSACHRSPTTGTQFFSVPTDYATLTTGSGGVNKCLTYASTDRVVTDSFIFAITQGAACGSSAMVPVDTSVIAVISAWLTDGAPNN